MAAVIHVEISCFKHPRYKAKRKPKSGCKICRNIYQTMQRLRVGLLELKREMEGTEED